jgi:DGQHR domain-containing protein
MPQEVVITCQMYEIHNGDMVFPYYLGALDAKELRKVSDAPSFGYDTPNNQIAAEVLVPPTQHWQRPLKAEKVQAIAARFDMDSEIMPNPVLLAVNPDKGINLSPDVDGHGHRTGLWTIRIPVPENAMEQKPLWIIDGQHRVMGMAETTRSNSPLPFVLLYSSQDAYMPAVLAKIFAQVTTEATPLNVIHQAWMQFVFNLGDYSEDTPSWRAMKTAALLCSTQAYGPKPNPFYGKVGFNPELEPQSISPGGFSFDAKYLQDLLKDKYFKNQGGQFPLSEDKVATEISLAIQALKGAVRREVDRTAFFGDSRNEQKYFRDGFIAGVCAYLLENGSPRDWTEILNTLNFQNTNWDVSGWVNTTSGSAGTISKRVAFNCFEDVFKKGELPEDVENLCDYLQGKSSYINIEYKLLDDEDNPIRNSSQSIKVELPGGIQRVEKSIPANARYIKITSPCINAGPVTVSLVEKPFDASYNFGAFKKGRVFSALEMRQLKNKIVLNVKVDFYGDVTINKVLTINVRD